MYVFKTLNEVQTITERWLKEYNEEMPHDSLEDMTPLAYLSKYQSQENSNWQ
jgi:putative transposase